MTFLDALTQHSFLQNALLTGLLAALACGIVGTYVVARRISSIAGSIAHCVLGGLGAARYLQVVCGWEWFHPLYGALLSALAAAMVIGLVSLHYRQREDTVIQAVWAFGMAIGVVFIYKTPGYNEDLMSYLFGNILLVSDNEIRLLIGLDVIVVLAGLFFHRPLMAVCFDEEFSRLRGLNVEFFTLLLLILTALTVVVLVNVVGIVLVIALLTLPAATSGLFCKTLLGMMAGAVLLCAVVNDLGILLSYQPNLPSGATIILLACVIYILALVMSRLRTVTEVHSKGIYRRDAGKAPAITDAEVNQQP